MANYIKNNSSKRNQIQQFINRASQASVLASCYSVTESTSEVKGFHYCTTTGTGMAFLFCLPYLLLSSLLLPYLNFNCMLIPTLILPVGSQWYP